MNNFGKNLKHLREKNDYKQGDMKTLLGVKSSTWSHYETGKSEPPMELLISISNFFGVTLNELILDDLVGKSNLSDSRQRKTKPYSSNEVYSRLEEPSLAMNHVVKEIRKLRQDVDALKEVMLPA